MIRAELDELDYISKKDPALKILISEIGPLERGFKGTIFEAIVEEIIGQMLSNKVASIIYDRVVKMAGEVTPDRMVQLTNEELRSTGISCRKVDYIKSFSKKVIENEICLDNLYDLNDDEIVEYLTSIKGVGAWTAEMIALFYLGRKDIFSFRDAALKGGILKVHPEFKSLSRTRFEKLRKLYTPYCSIAALYYYYANDNDISMLINNTKIIV